MIFLLIGVASFIAGVMNAAAGGGTFVTFPVLTVVAQLSEKVANITSTIGLWPGTASSVAAAWSELRKIRPSVLAGYAIIGLIGGLAGALLLLTTPQRTFALAVPWLLLFATLVFALGKRISAWAGRGKGPIEPRFSAGVIPLLLVISLYNGYFGAGAGILMLAGLALAGLHDLRQMNALKVVIQTTANGAAVAVFAGAGVDWRLAGTMAGASFVGGYVGMMTAQRLPQKYVRALVMIIGVTLTAAYFLKVYKQ